MTPSDDARDLPPEQDAVRRLLAEARHDEPVPLTVVARLDSVLEELSAERREVRPTAPVVDLGARRRRGVGVALVAAAAIVVAGVGFGQVLGRGGLDSGDGSDSGASGGSTLESSGEEDRAGESGPAGAAGSDDRAPAERKGKENEATLAGPAFDVSTGSLRRDLRDARSSTASFSTSSLPEACAPGEAPLDREGRPVPVTLDGQPALALYRVPQGGRQQVDVYLCGSEVPAESVTLRTH